MGTPAWGFKSSCPFKPLQYTLLVRYILCVPAILLSGEPVGPTNSMLVSVFCTYRSYFPSFQIPEPSLLKYCKDIKQTAASTT
jgi:hypothetical protein